MLGYTSEQYDPSHQNQEDKGELHEALHTQAR